MNAGKFRGSIVACLALAALLAISASAGGVAAKSDTRVLKIVETQDVDFSTVVGLPDSEGIWEFLEANHAIRDALLTILDMDCLDQAREFLDAVGAIGIDVDGKVHINMMAWVNEDSADIKLHLSWHGTVVVTLIERGSTKPLANITLDFKNIQFMTHATIAFEPPYVIELKVNVHVNGDAMIDDAEEYDISFHVLLKISDGELQMLKIWVPTWLDAMLAEI
jgi:hypothetical protein